MGHGVPVNEKNAIEYGQSTSAPRDSEEEEQDEDEEEESSSFWNIAKQTKLSKKITIFIRERFWLEVHGIIDRPPASELALAPDVTDLINSNGEADSTGANGNAENRTRVKTEVKLENVFAPGEIVTLE